jgi:hypothetical protein
VAPEPQQKLRARVNRDTGFGYALLFPTALLIVVLIGFPFSGRSGLVSQEIARRAGRTVDRPEELHDRPPRSRLLAVGEEHDRVHGRVHHLQTDPRPARGAYPHEAIPLRGLWRSIVLLPYAMPTLVSVLVWKWMYNDVGGVFNYLLQKSTIRTTPTLWLADPSKAMGSVIAVNVWRGFPFCHHDPCRASGRATGVV